MRHGAKPETLPPHPPKKTRTLMHCCSEYVDHNCRGVRQRHLPTHPPTHPYVRPAATISLLSSGAHVPLPHTRWPPTGTMA